MRCRFLPLLFAALLLAGTAGCRTSLPQLFAPGTLQQQRTKATVHDPYADNSAGPEVLGGRPREFDKPPADPVRTQSLWDRIRGK
jgi:hypothetical protein